MHELLTERPNLFEPNDHMSFYLEMSCVCYEKLHQAIYKAYLNNETTCCKIILQKDGKAYYEKMNDTTCRIEKTDLDWKDIISIQEKIPFNLKEGEMMRCYIREYEDKTSLFIFAHHLVGDGKAIMCFINDVMNALIGKELTYKPLKLLTLQDITRDYQLPKKAIYYTRFCNWRWKLMGNKTFNWNDYENIHRNYWKQYTSKITYHTFSKEETLKIKQLAKIAGVSVNTLLTTAIVQIDDLKHSIGMITSLREKENATMANLISGISSTQQYQPQLSFNENAQIIHKKIQRSLNKYRYFVINFMSAFTPALIDGILLCTHGCLKSSLLDEISRVTGYKGNFTRDIGITNLTVLDVPHQFENYTIQKLIVVAPLISYTRKVICVSTFNDQLTLAYHDMVKDGKENKEFFEKVLFNLQKHLD